MIDIYLDNIKERPDIFPIKWHINSIYREEVEITTGDINPSSHLITKCRLNSYYWKKKSLDKLIRSYKEAWNYKDDLIIVVWDVNQKEREPPLGFISFYVLWQETRTKRIRYLSLSIDLIWVRPDKRGLGGIVARHIVTHLIHYLMDCKLIHPYVSVRGVDVTLHADFFSQGGEKVSDIIAENLNYLKESNFWNIREFEYDAGY